MTDVDQDGFYCGDCGAGPFPNRSMASSCERLHTRDRDWE